MIVERINDNKCIKITSDRMNTLNVYDISNNKCDDFNIINRSYNRSKIYLINVNDRNILFLSNINGINKIVEFKNRIDLLVIEGHFLNKIEFENIINYIMPIDVMILNSSITNLDINSETELIISDYIEYKWEYKY